MDYTHNPKHAVDAIIYRIRTTNSKFDSFLDYHFPRTLRKPPLVFSALRMRATSSKPFIYLGNNDTEMY